MKFFNKLILLGIIVSTVLLSQSVKISNGLIVRNSSDYINIFIYNVTDLESMQIKFEYDESIIIADEIVTDIYDNLLSSDYQYITNVSDPGIVELGIALWDDESNIFSGNTKIAKISFESIGQIGYSALHFLDVQVNSVSHLSSSEDGSIEIIIDELPINAIDTDAIGSGHSITIGMCDGCSDNWKFGEDEYDYPDPASGPYTNIHFFHPDWFGQIDENNNTCDQIEFASDFRQPHSFSQLINWGISGNTGGGLSNESTIKLSWDNVLLNSNSDNFKMYLYVEDEDVVDMQQESSITIQQSSLELNELNEPIIQVIVGACSDVGTNTYYFDSDGDSWGSDQQGEYCSSYKPEDWVENNFDIDDNIYCPSNEEDCTGILCGEANYDDCGICSGGNSGHEANSNKDDCGDCFGNNSRMDCAGICLGLALIDNCGVCDNNSSNNCEMDCSGEWGGVLIVDVCNICGGLETDPNNCEVCTEGIQIDCFGFCGGSAELDDCGICVGGNTGVDSCTQDCNGIWGGTFWQSDCGCVSANNSGNECDDCMGIPNGNAYLDECGTCDNNSSNDCIQDCSDEWGGSAQVDNCGICVGGNTGSEPCIQDCNGVWGGYSVLDDCEVCDGGNLDMDCNGTCQGNEGYLGNGEGLNEYGFDECGICDGNGIQESCDCNYNQLDCAGYCGGTAVLDDCGVCQGDNSANTGTCDCAGAPNGTAYTDNCGICDDDSTNDCEEGCDGVLDSNKEYDNCGLQCIADLSADCSTYCDNDSSNDCVKDCAGIWGGTAYPDNCGTCVGGTTGIESCLPDCNGVLGGTFWLSDCGCVSANNSGNDCDDCMGIPNGNSFIDECGVCNGTGFNDYGCCEDEVPDCVGLCGGVEIPTFNCPLGGDLVCYMNDCYLDLDPIILPKNFEINTIYPNPFNPQAIIEYKIAEPTKIKLEIYNIRGQKLDVLKNDYVFPGNYSAIWDGSIHPSGIYFVILYSNQSIIRKKMILLK